MAMSRKVFVFDFCIGSARGVIILQWPLAQLFPAAWAGSMGQSIKKINLLVYFFKNHLINLIHRCLCSNYVDGYAKESFCFDFCIGSACGAIILQWPLAQLFPAAWAGIMGQC